MDLQTAKINVMQKIMNVSKASLLDKISNILDEEMTVGYTTDGKPLTMKQYNERLLVAEKQIKHSPSFATRGSSKLVCNEGKAAIKHYCNFI